MTRFERNKQGWHTGVFLHSFGMQHSTNPFEQSDQSNAKFDVL